MNQSQQYTARNASLADLVEMLRTQAVRKIDMVVPAGAIRSKDGMIAVDGVQPILSDDGVTDANGLYLPTRIFDEGISDRFGIPLSYVRRLREERPDLMDANVNGWLHGGATGPDGNGDVFDTDSRSFLMRAFRGDTDEPGIGRALLSNSYAIVDNLDVLMEALGAIREAGVEAVVDRANLTDRRMSVDIVVPEVQVLAEDLLRGYRNSFGDDFTRWQQVADREGLGYGGEEPVIWAGVRISNSETGGGAYQIVPTMKIKVCANGLVITRDAIRAVHLGARLDAGVVRWSEETHTKNIELIKAKTRDAIRTFIDTDYMTAQIAQITEKATRPVRPEEVKVITKAAKYTDAQQDEILAHFIRGGQTTRGGVMQAATAAAQMVADPDVAHDMEAKAVSLLTA